MAEHLPSAPKRTRPELRRWSVRRTLPWVHALLTALPFLLCCATPIRAQTANNWTNAANSAWTNASAWSLGVPTGTQDLYHTNTATQISLNTNGVAKSLTIGGGSGTSTLLFNANRSLTLGGGITLAPGAGNGTLNLGSGTNTLTLNGGAGSIINGGGAGSAALTIGAGFSNSLGLLNASLDELNMGQSGTGSSVLVITNGQTYNVAGILRLNNSTGSNNATILMNGGTLNQLATSEIRFNSGNGAGNTAYLILNSNAVVNARAILRGNVGADAAIEWNDGTIANYAGTNLTISASAGTMNLRLAGMGTHTFHAESGRTITVASTAQLQDKAGEAGTLRKTGAGSLVFQGFNPYTGLTTIEQGTLVVTNTSFVATLASDSVAVTFASAPALGTYPILAGPVAGDTLAARSVGVAGGGAVGNAIITNTPNLAVVVGAVPVITSPTDVSGIVGLPFTYQITADHNPTSYAASGLPAGLSLDGQTGLISGTPTSAVFGGSFDVTAVNAFGSTSRTIYVGLFHNSEAEQGDFSNDPSLPSPVALAPPAGSIWGSVGGSDPVDFLTFTVPEGYRLQALRLRLYQSYDTTGFIAVDEGATWTAGDEASAMLGSGWFGPGDFGGDLLGAMGVSGGSLGSGTYTLRLQRLGGAAAYGLEFKLAADGAPGGEITATPPTIFLFPGQLGTSIISWTTTGFSNAEVYVYTDSNPAGRLFGRAPSATRAPADWIGPGRVLFRLYGGTNQVELLDEVTVTAIPAPSGSIAARPERFYLAETGATFSTTLSWTASEDYGYGGWVTRSTAGGAEQLVAQGASNAGLEVSGLGAGDTTFRLYADAARTRLLGAVTVTGTTPPPNRITARPSKFTLGVDETFSTILSWTTEVSGGWVTRSVNGGTEEPFAQGASHAGLQVSGLGAGRTVFRLYGDEARTKLLDLVEVIGTTAPLTVQADGTLRLDNRPFSGFGVNYYDALNRVLENGADTSYEAGFAELGRWGLPFARLDFSGFWPSRTSLFFTDRAEYFRRLDGVVAAAERHGVGLIPSLFWTHFTFPDLAGEHLDQLAVSNSVTRQMMREFATEIVNRYKHSRAIWAWEFGNELNLAVDLPNSEQHLPPTFTNLGNPPTRDPVRDALATDTLLPAMLDIGHLITELDPGRPLSTGHGMSRPSQWHQDQWKRGLLPIGSVYTTDSAAQAEEITLRLCPDPYDLLSVHVYEIDSSQNEPQRLPNFAAFAARAGKALFAGEFGTSIDKAKYDAMLSNVRMHSPLAAVWVFDRSVDDFRITTTNERSWMLRELLPSTFTRWSRGMGVHEVPGPDGLTAGAQYIFGSPRPGVAAQRSAAGWSTNALRLEAVVRTNDPTWRIVGQTSATLAPGSWGTNDVVWISSTNQSDVLPGCERRVFTVPSGTDTRKFLRITAESP